MLDLHGVHITLVHAVMKCQSYIITLQVTHSCHAAYFILLYFWTCHHHWWQNQSYHWRSVIEGHDQLQ